MNELALFVGAGGGFLGSRLLGWRTVGAVEIDPYCREVLLRRQEEEIIEPFPIWDDIRTFDGKPWRGKVDIITAGFPCQPFSVAGRRAGKDDERNMWPETARVIREVRPRYCFLENVPGLLVHEYFGEILKDLAESGYDCWWDCIPASAVGAPHRRDRLWILAYPTDDNRWSGERRTETGIGADGERGRGSPGGGQGVADSDTERLFGGGIYEERQEGLSGSPRGDRCGTTTWWETDPADIPDTGEQRREEREGQPRNDGQEQPSVERGCRERRDIGSADIPDSEQQHDDDGRYGTGEICRERSEATDISGGKGEDVSDAENRGQPMRRGASRTGRHSVREDMQTEEQCNGQAGPTQPRLGRVAHGVANRVDRLKAIGNGQVPEVVRTAWELLMEGMGEEESDENETD